MDDLCESLHLERTGDTQSCREIFQARGEKYFRALEREAIEELQVEDALVATGAGAVLDSRNVKKLKNNGIIVYLRLDSETLKKRLLTGVLPAYIDRRSPEESFEKMLEERKAVYEKIADKTIDVTLSSIEEAAETLSRKIQKWMRSYV